MFFFWVGHGRERGVLWDMQCNMTLREETFTERKEARTQAYASSGHERKTLKHDILDASYLPLMEASVLVLTIKMKVNGHFHRTFLFPW